MNKLNIQIPSLTHSVNLDSDISVRLINPEQPPRLIVLIPEDVDCSRVTRRIWELANATGSSVKLLALCRDSTEEMSLRRELVTVSALIQDAKISVESKIEIGTNWVKVVKRNYQDGDMIVCIAEQSVGFRRKPLSQLLESTMQVPVYVLSEIPMPKPQAKFFPRMLATWSGFAGIMIGFFILQIRVVQVAKDGFQTLLLLVLLIPEFWLIWAWNSLFS
jgi:hypothetical protein